MQVTAVTYGSRAVANPITAAGTILAADPESAEPVVAATANACVPPASPQPA